MLTDVRKCMPVLGLQGIRTDMQQQQGGDLSSQAALARTGAEQAQVCMCVGVGVGVGVGVWV